MNADEGRKKNPQKGIGSVPSHGRQAHRYQPADRASGRVTTCDAANSYARAAAWSALVAPLLDIDESTVLLARKHDPESLLAVVIG